MFRCAEQRRLIATNIMPKRQIYCIRLFDSLILSPESPVCVSQTGMSPHIPENKKNN